MLSVYVCVVWFKSITSMVTYNRPRVNCSGESGDRTPFVENNLLLRFWTKLGHKGAYNSMKPISFRNFWICPWIWNYSPISISTLFLYNEKACIVPTACAIHVMGSYRSLCVRHVLLLVVTNIKFKASRSYTV